MRRSLPLVAILGLPFGLMVISLIGLVGALIYDGAWDNIGWALLALTIGVALWAWLRTRIVHRR
ncbi:MAG: hypothetical protein DCF29_08815 [Alphaproteobacteria bacterium]|nr:MAG: hypothetical protein DCF29_08815 [Alphaproteobacteria bacterium]